MTANKRILDLLDKLIREADEVINTQQRTQDLYLGHRPTFVSLEPFTTWRARCKLLASLLGPVGAPWKSELTDNAGNTIGSAVSTRGTLRAIKASAEEGLLLRIEDLVMAEAFANLLEQAEYLFGEGYFLAAGVILRAVLEEHLRRLCGHHSIVIAKARPTLNDYNTELYKAQFFDKIAFKDIDALIAIGNDAAHNNPTLTADQVGRLLEGVKRILAQFPC